MGADHRTTALAPCGAVPPVRVEGVHQEPVAEAHGERPDALGAVQGEQHQHRAREVRTHAHVAVLGTPAAAAAVAAAAAAAIVGAAAVEDEVAGELVRQEDEHD